MDSGLSRGAGRPGGPGPGEGAAPSQVLSSSPASHLPVAHTCVPTSPGLLCPLCLLMPTSVSAGSLPASPWTLSSLGCSSSFPELHLGPKAALPAKSVTGDGGGWVAAALWPQRPCAPPRTTRNMQADAMGQDCGLWNSAERLWGGEGQAGVREGPWKDLRVLDALRT